MMSVVASAQNLITNGNFENGFSGWDNRTNNGGAATYSLETEGPYAGTNSMKVAVITFTDNNPPATNQFYRVKAE
jgi:hypothetical protein